MQNRHLSVDKVIAVILLLAALIAYISTLAPTLLDGDAALFQYIPLTLGITYPTGYPVYILVSKIWLTLFPFGEIAWRMNLFSALSAAFAMPIFYTVAHRILRNRWGALSAVLLFSTLSTYWRWATSAKIYTFNILLFSIVLYFATLPQNPKHKTRNAMLTAFFLGLQMGVHSTTLLLLPGIIALFWANNPSFISHGFRKSNLKSGLGILAAFAIPASLYLYIPIRAEILIAQMGRETAIRHGLLADFYHSGLGGWIHYFTAADFTGGVVTNWGIVPHDLFSVYFSRLMAVIDFGWMGVAWGLLGILVFIVWKPLRHWALPLFLLYAIPIPFVLTYGQGEQNAFLLPSNLIFSLFAGGVVAQITNYELRITNLSVRKIILGLTLFATLILPFQHARYNINGLNNKWDTAQFDYWTDALAHPLEDGAGIMATWGDLTSMWYLQHAENKRTDLAGLYPPTSAVAAEWVARGQSLYVAGPVLGAWRADDLAKYRAIPWGRLVRLLPLDENPATTLPALNQIPPRTFNTILRVDGVAFPAQILAGKKFTLQLRGQILADLPLNTYYSLRLAQSDGKLIVQKDDVIRPGWYPAEVISANTPWVGAYSLIAPKNTPMGDYRLQMVIYNTQDGGWQEWSLENGDHILDLGTIKIVKNE